MKRKIMVGVVAVVIVGLVVGGYYMLRNRNNNSEDGNVTLTEVQKVLTKDLDSNYPATPREVVKMYNRILLCFYNETYTDEELEGLGDQARLLFDEELLENNPRDAYFDALRADIAEYHEKERTVRSTSVCDSNDVIYKTVDKRECAYVDVSYFVNEDKQYNYTYQIYVLRKDEEERWKILVFYQAEGKSDE